MIFFFFGGGGGGGVHFHKEYKGNYSPSAGQLDECPDTARMSSAHFDKNRFKSDHEKPASQDFPFKISYNGDVTLIIPVSPAYATNS